ncbi:hypothetical protein B6U67_03735 [Methanosarcinales archaeon ex4484_138]|nr:MAG: hypothetical protein B6U67_03735 [Methanosarcinales archaeon ex4484_138]
MKWNFRKIDEHVAVSEEEYNHPVFKEDVEKIQIYLEDKMIDGDLAIVSGEVSRFLQVTVGNIDNRIHYYLELKTNGYLYELFGNTVRKTIDAINTSGRFYALELTEGAFNALIYTWGKEWYLVAPLVKQIID